MEPRTADSVSTNRHPEKPRGTGLVSPGITRQLFRYLIRNLVARCLVSMTGEGGKGIFFLNLFINFSYNCC